MEGKSDAEDKRVAKQVDIFGWIVGGLLIVFFVIRIFGGQMFTITCDECGQVLTNLEVQYCNTFIGTGKHYCSLHFPKIENKVWTVKPQIIKEVK